MAKFSPKLNNKQLSKNSLSHLIVDIFSILGSHGSKSSLKAILSIIRPGILYELGGGEDDKRFLK